MPSLEEMFEAIAPHLYEMHIYEPGQVNEGHATHGIRFCRKDGPLRAVKYPLTSFRDAVEALYNNLETLTMENHEIIAKAKALVNKKKEHDLGRFREVVLAYLDEMGCTEDDVIWPAEGEAIFFGYRILFDPKFPAIPDIEDRIGVHLQGLANLIATQGEGPVTETTCPTCSGAGEFEGSCSCSGSSPQFECGRCGNSGIASLGKCPCCFGSGQVEVSDFSKHDGGECCLPVPEEPEREDWSDEPKGLLAAELADDRQVF